MASARLSSLIYEIDRMNAKHVTAVDGWKTLSPHSPTDAGTGIKCMTIEIAAGQQRDTKRWGTVAVIVGCGVAAALHVGKVPIAASILQATFGIDLAAIGT